MILGLSPKLLKENVKSVLGALRLGPTVQEARGRIGYLFDRETQRRNARFKRQYAPDGFAMPPPKLIYLVTGQFGAEAFYHSGLLGATCIQDILKRHGLDMGAFSTVLDFGCGCGRVIRHWKTLSGAKLYGVDYNPELINWCRRNLQFAEFGIDKAGVPLDFAEGTFDFIYAVSVFTHLMERGQTFWMDEIMRVLKPGGYFLFTVHGVSRLSDLSAEQRKIFESGKPVIVGSQYSGTNSCGTYHPQEYVRDVLCREWSLLAFEPGAAKDANQDAFLMQKPDSMS